MSGDFTYHDIAIKGLIDCATGSRETGFRPAADAIGHMTVECARLNAALVELDTYADHTNMCRTGDTGDHADCTCGYTALHDRLFPDAKL
jgi:hypothetical protein